MVCLAEHTIGGAKDIYTRHCKNKAQGIFKDLDQPDNGLFFPVAIRKKVPDTSDQHGALRKSFYPNTMRILNKDTV